MGRVLALVLRAAGLLSTVAVFVSPALAADWVSNGPPGASVYVLAPASSQPSTVYAGTGRGVWRGERGGAVWQLASAGLPVDRVAAVAVDPSDAQTLFAGTVTPAGTPSEGLFRSTDGGQSWSAANDGLVDPVTGFEPLDVAALSIDPSNPQVILAGTRFSEIFGSTDGGATWTPRTFGGFSINLETTGFARDPSNPQRIWAASSDGILLSSNGGGNWAFVGNAAISFFCIAVDPAQPATLYAGNTTGFGIARSTDGGATWSLVNGNLPQNTLGGISFFPAINAVAVPPDGSAVFLATQGNGLFRSTDGGTNWTAIDTGLNERDLRSLAFLPSPGAALLAGGNGGGVYRSTDAGATWTTSSLGLAEALISEVVAHPSSPGVAYASAFDGVWSTQDGGRSWQRASGGLPSEPVASLALRFAVSIQPGDVETLYAGTLGAGLYASVDGGQSWSPRGSGLDDDNVAAVSLDPSNVMTLWAGTAHPYDGTNSQRVYKSTDAGATWHQTGLNAGGFSIGVIVVDPNDGNRVAAVSRGAAGYFQTVNGGTSWSVVTPGAASGCAGVNTVSYLTGGRIVLGVNNGVCVSDDGGSTWTNHAVATLAAVYDFLGDPQNASTLAAAVAPAVPGGTGGVFVSSDAGLTWSPLGTGLETYAVRTLARDASDDLLYAGIQRGGVATLSSANPPERTVPTPPPADHATRVVPAR